MLEGLPPNNAAHMMRLTIDEPRARAVADLIVESFEPAEAASTAFETETPWPGGGKAWQVEVYFGFAPDQDACASSSRLRQARRRRRGRIRRSPKSATGSPMRSPACRRCGRDASSSMARTTARASGHRYRRRDRGGARVRHRPSRHHARLPAAFRPPAEPPAAAESARRRLRRRRARDRRRQGVAAQGLARRHRSDRGGSRQRQRAPQRRRAPPPSRSSRAASRTERSREGGPFDVVFANILAKPLRRLAPSLAAVTAPDGEAIVSGLLYADVPGVLAAWRAQGFYPSARIDLEGWASLLLRRDGTRQSRGAPRITR